MIEAYFRHVPAEDQPKTAEDVLGIVDGHWRVGQHRRPGEVKIRVFNPRRPASEGAVGWTDTKTVIDIVTDDMPSLVDSVIGALTMQNVTVHRVLHPILISRRDAERRPAWTSPGSPAGLDPETGDHLRASPGCTS